MATSLPKQGFTSSILVRIALNLVPWNHPRAMVLTWANHHQVLSRGKIREFWGQSHFGIKVISNVEHAKWCIIKIYIYMMYCISMYVSAYIYICICVCVCIDRFMYIQCINCVILSTSLNHTKQLGYILRILGIKDLKKETPWCQWELQDPKMEVLYHIRPYFVGLFPYIGIIYDRYLQFRLLLS